MNFCLFFVNTTLLYRHFVWKRQIQAKKWPTFFLYPSAEETELLIIHFQPMGYWVRAYNVDKVDQIFGRG